ncbi:hypothetical protein BS78_10G063400 [Paspalum vaginatum]|nr:hypothetical protein BS78_10G063400 [Paspalum vaginatum]
MLVSIKRPAGSRAHRAMRRSGARFSSWLLVVAFVLLCSCAARAACSSPRPPPAAADDGGEDARDEPWLAPPSGAVAAAGSGGASRHGRRAVWDRRSLGSRTWIPPSPLANGPRTMPAPPPPLV